MFYERLEFAEEKTYEPEDLAIHMARYSLTQAVCQGLNVLDVACGDGYGSYAMAKFWGANKVVGVDISAEAINFASKTFASSNIEWKCSPAEELNQLFEHHSFDMVVSLETIEHVNDPERFLSAISDVLKPGGLVIMSCPNDYKIYGNAQRSGNPHHLRMYSLPEFQQVCEKYFGPDSRYLLGCPIYGFGNFSFSSNLSNLRLADTMQDALFKMRPLLGQAIQSSDTINEDNCSYFVGLWGDLAPQVADNGVVFAGSIDNLSLPSQSNWLKESVKNYEIWSKDLKQSLDQTRSLLEQEESKTQRIWAELQHYKDLLEQEETKAHKIWEGHEYHRLGWEQEKLKTRNLWLAIRDLQNKLKKAVATVEERVEK